jgi:signal transduction histidine kinase/CheY-like chemotaxis protein
VLYPQDLGKNDVPAAILENVSWLGFGEPSQYLAVITLRTKELVRGFIVLGLNPRRKLDADHEQFVADIAHHVKRLMLKTISDENTQKREENLTLELSDVERRISRLAEIVPAGIYELSADGSLSWANSHFYDILGVPHDRREFSLFAWPDYILAEDRVRAAEEMGRCLTDAVEITDSLRLRKSYNPPVIGQDFEPKDAPFWIMYSASPDVRPDGSVRSLMGSLTDISHLKWAEQLQITNVEVAQRDRQRNEEFIDITSHEMRNPLSAITQCADSIISSLTDAHDRNDVQSLIDIVKSNIEAAESILFCACHQRRIIDDVLTLGKLDSELLTIAPTAFHPNDLVDQALQMFKTEFDANKIEVQICADENSALASTSVAYADAYRLMQILVNMLTNAIKFTRMQPDRNIQIRSGSSLSAPSADTFGPGFEWYPTQISRPDLTQEADYGEGEVVYLYYAVVDSGKGIQPDFISRVFSKFEQADRRTHTKYGGSGLGLYISRELAELQGGRIGIQSADGAGSTFAFYTKARRSQIATTEESEPATDAHVTPNMAQAFGSLKLAGSGTPTRSPLSTDYNILLVEDNILNQKILAKQLTRVGCVVRVANHGGEAIDYILQMHNLPVEFGTLPSEDQVPYFDCILMDWEMPVCDGLNATTRIREIEAQQDGKRNTIIGITANARTGQITMATGAGMDPVLPKPFRVAQLLSKIRESVTR